MDCIFNAFNGQVGDWWNLIVLQTGIRWAQGRWRTRHLELVGMGQSAHGHGGVGSLSPEAPSARKLSYRAIIGLVDAGRACRLGQAGVPEGKLFR